MTTFSFSTDAPVAVKAGVLILPVFQGPEFGPGVKETGLEQVYRDAKLTATFDTVFTAEAWGSDAYTPLAWWGRETTRMRLGTSVIQLSARTPTARDRALCRA